MNVVCSNCKFGMEYSPAEGPPAYCPQCGLGLSGPMAGHPAKTPSAEPLRYYTFEFTATAGEYFRIWVVNLFLTVITLGVYAAWAKVRTRRYIWGNTSLAGHPFTFHGNPVAILRGNLIIAGLFIAYVMIKKFDPAVAGILFLVFSGIFPFLVCKSLRFNAFNTSYRNIRFHFMGSLKEAYETYLLYAYIAFLTAFVFFPAWQYYKKKFFFNNLAYGSTGGTFTGRKGPFYKVYFLSSFVGGFIFIGLTLVGGYWAYKLAVAAGATPGQARGTTMIFSMMFTYLFIALIIYSAQAVIYSVTMNHCWANMRMGRLSFQSTLKARTLLYIRITNMLAVLFSLGLLIPWAKIRRIRYVLNNLTVISSAGLDDLTAGYGRKGAAIGDSATDFVGIEIGL